MKDEKMLNLRQHLHRQE